MSVGRRTESSAAADDGSAILWYKHDLRIDDHPGLLSASQHQTLVPLYVFDHRILSRFTDETFELLLSALGDLKSSLMEQGSNLMIRFGSSESVIEEVVKEVDASSVFAEEEVEYVLCEVVNGVKETLARISFAERRARVVVWNTPFYDIGNVNDLPASYDEFMKKKMPITSPHSSPKLPKVPMDLSWGALPTLDDLKNFVGSNADTSKVKWAFKFSAWNWRQKDRSLSSIIEGLRKTKSSEGNQIVSSDVSAPRNRVEKSAFVTEQGNIVAGGTHTVLNALAAYLRYLEGTARDEWQEVHGKLRDAETREGASFGTLFGYALLLGIVSRRRVYYEAIKYEKERNGGFLSPFGYSTVTVAAAIDTVCSMEWYWLLALKSQAKGQGNLSVRIWRWNGHLIHYTVAGDRGPAIMLVHGFGAFFGHYRDNINPIAKSGNRVWALTLLGFGKSEKPNVVYSEVMLAELIKDFIVDVVREPVHLVGNSLGGYLAAIVTGIWPALVKSVVLVNSAGNVVPDYTASRYSKVRQKSGAAWLGARFLSLFLRFSLRNIVRDYYPTRRDRVDEWLISEMLRASYDPGVMVVLESIFSFDLSVPLNYLLQGFERRSLVIQGMKDPLVSDNSSRLAMLRKHCKGILTRELDAGHCPQDEKPEEVNSILQEWVATVEGEALTVSPPEYKSIREVM